MSNKNKRNSSKAHVEESKQGVEAQEELSSSEGFSEEFQNAFKDEGESLSEPSLENKTKVTDSYHEEVRKTPGKYRKFIKRK